MDHPLWPTVSTGIVASQSRQEEEEASRHLEEARCALDELKDDPYGAMIGKGVECLANRLDASPMRPAGGPTTL